MRWFKHFTDNHRGRSIQYLLDEMGHLGPCSYFFLVEMCAEKLNQKSDKRLESSDCFFSFHQRIVRQNLRVSLANLRRLLDICQEVGLLTFKISGNTIEIKMPILLNLLESDQKKSRQASAIKAPQSRLEQNRIEENIYIAQSDQKSDMSGKVKKNFELEGVYALYPRKREKSKGLKKLQAQIKTQQDYNRLVQAVKNYSKLCANTEQQYIKHFSTFANCWRDYVEIEDFESKKDPNMQSVNWDDDMTFGV